tara:strand:- start:576 stop:4367 length:3792 start_codon:yes stop_codon:yes gene_type:complete
MVQPVQTGNVSPITITREKMEEYQGLFADDPGGAGKIVADTVARALAIDNPGLLSYDTLRDGTADWFNFQPATSTLAPAERKLSDSQILKYFTVDEDGNPPLEGTFLDGFMRQIIPEGAGLGGAFTGAKIGAKLQAPIPPAGPLAIATKIAIPTITTTLGFFGAYSAAEEGLEAILGKERVILPEHMADYKSGKTGATVAPWLFFPWMVSKNVALGGSSYLTNLNNMLLKGPVTASDALKPGVSQALATGKGPRIARISRGVETMLRSTKETALRNPKTTFALEAAAGLGAVKGRYEAEQRFPGDETVGTLAEIGGGLTPSLLGATLLQTLPGVKNTINNYIKAYQSGGLKGIRDQASEAQLNLALAEIRDQFDLEGYTPEDIQNLIQNLRSSDFVELQDLGSPLTAGQKAADPVLLAMQASLERTNRGLGKQRRESNIEANAALRGIILTMAATGDKEMIKQAAVLQKAIFDAGLTDELASVTDQVLAAAERVGATASNRDISSNIQLVTGNLLEEARLREKRLWSSIPDLQITSFVNAEGVEQALPNFLLNWQSILPRTPEAAAEYAPKLRNIQAFVDRKAAEFGVGQLAAPIEAALPELKKLDNLKTKLSGTIYEESLSKFMKAQEDLSINEQITKLRSEANRFRGKFSGKRGKDYANVLDAQAEFLVASERQRIDTFEAARQSGEVAPASLSVVEVQDMRSTALNIGRQALANGDLQTARMAHAFADDLLSDLESFPEGASIAYDSARAFSRSLNDTFTRAFAGDILTMDKRGAQRVAPELLHKKLFVSGDDATYLRVEQLTGAANFAVDNGLTGAESARASIFGGLEGLVRNARREAMDPVTGEIDQRRLDNWIATNTGTPESPKLLDFFPNVKNDLQEASSANALLKTTIFDQKKTVSDLRNQVTFMDLLPNDARSFENPALVISRVMAPRAKAPMKSLANLSSMIKAAPEDMQDQARAGLRSGILEWAVTTSGGETGFGARAIYDGLFGKIPGANSNVSLTDWAVTNGVMTDSQVNKIKKVVTNMVKLEAGAAQNVDFDQFMADTGPMLDFYLRIAGSGMGERAASMTGSGNTLIAQGAGSRALRRVYSRLFNEIPASLKGKAIIELFENPSLLADMLEKPRTDAQALNLAQRLRNQWQELGFIEPAASGVSSGVRRSAPYVGSELGEKEEEYVPAPPQEGNPFRGGISSVTPAAMPAPPPPPIPTQPVAPPTTTLASVAPPPPLPTGGGQVDRSRFAALFPEDRALIEGIGSLRV